MADLACAYRKTEAGMEELAAKRCGLTREQRNLLIVADGRHPLAVYGRVVGGEPAKLAVLAESLVALGLIEAAGESVALDGPPPVAADSGSSLRQMMALATAIFGDQAAPVLARLDKAGSSEDGLRAAVEQAAKLAKLTIDAEQAGSFLAEARKLLDTA